MLIKHLNHGTGRASKAVTYLLQEQDSKGETRAEVTVLRGDPRMVAVVADSLSFKFKYTSGVIAWAPEDQPSAGQIETVLDDYEALAFSGLSNEQYCFSAVLHREINGGVHIHTFAARVELISGKSFNPAPPGHQKQFDQIVHHHNWQHGWARPDDQSRARSCSKGHLHYQDMADLKEGIAVEPDSKQVITDYLEQCVVNETVRNRDDMRTVLASLGEITREGKNYISVKPEGHTRAIRLRGTIYEQDFDSTAQGEAEGRAGGSRGIDLEKSQAARLKFERMCEKRANFNRKKYQRVDSKDRQGKQPIRQINDTPVSVNASINDPDLGSYLRQQLGTDAIPLLADCKQILEVEANQQEPNRSRPAAKCSHNRRGDTVQTSGQTESLAGRKNGKLDSKSREEELNVIGIDNDITQQIIRANRANRAISDAGARLSAVCAGVKKTAARAVKAIRSRIATLIDEQGRFKTQINLPEYINDQGYEYDHTQSTIGYKVFQKDQDRIIVTKTSDGQYEYISSVNPLDKGTVVDFVQSRFALNSNQVRKVLRPWVSSADPDPQKKRKHKLPDGALKFVKTNSDYGLLASTWLNASNVFDFSYLESKRIRRSTVQLYAKAIKQNEEGALLCMHIGTTGVSGYEYYKHDCVGFSDNGQKGLFVLQPQVDLIKVKKMVITETAIDALLYAQSDKCRPDTAYVSTAGKPTKKQISQIEAVKERFGLELIVAQKASVVGDRWYRNMGTNKGEVDGHQEAIEPKQADFSVLR